MKRFITAILLTSIPVAVTASNTAGILGDSSVEASVDNNSPGQAEAFPAAAQTSGTLTALNVFLDASNSAQTVVVGLYSSNGNPATLLTRGGISHPQAGAWNTVAVSPVSITAGNKYWIAILGLNGTVQFRDRQNGPCTSKTSSQTSLTSLPASWTSGAAWPTCPASAYGTLTTGTPPSISVTISPASANLQSSQTAQFSAMINGVASNAVTWSATGGAITSGGLYTAGSTAGTFSVTATSTADTTKSASASVTVTVPAPSVSVSVQPASVTLAPGSTQSFTATVTGTSNTAVTWSATGGTISSAGLYTAPGTTGTFTVTAQSVADTTKSSSATVTVSSSSSTALAQAAANAPVGTWTQFTAAQNASWNGGALLDLTGTSDNTTTWSTKGMWNPATREFYFLGGGHCGNGASGCPGTQSIVRYGDSSNTWSSTVFQDSGHSGHTYEGPTINTSAGANNNIYFRPFNDNSVEVYSIASQGWISNAPSVPSAGGPDCCLSMEYFPDRNSLITIDNDWGIYEYSFASGQWSGCLFNTSSDVCGAPGGTHVLAGAGSTESPWARYDSAHKRLLLGGGTNVYALSTSLALTQLASAPFDISVGTSASPVTIDPATGNLVSWNASGMTFTSDGTSWVSAGASPFSDPVNSGLVCAPVSTYNVIMCFYAGTSSSPVTGGTLWLYKFQTSGAPPASSVAVSITPSTANIQTGKTAQFKATVTGTTNTAVTWSSNGGTVTSTGLYTAPATAGTWTVTATSSADTTKSAFATVTVTAPVVSVTISPTSATLAVGKTQAFTATVTGTTNTTVDWATSGGTISSTGVLTAPTSTGTVTVTATSAADATKSASANVNVVPNSTGAANGWSSRTSGVNIPGGQASVVGSQSFDSFPATNQQQYFQLYDPSSITTDCTIAADGCSLKFAVLKGYQVGEPGWFQWNFSPDLSRNFGNGQEFYIQYKERMDAGMLSQANFPGSAGFKQDITTEGDTASVQAGDCSNSPGEVVTVEGDSGMPILYHNCGFSGGQFAFMQSGYQGIQLPGIAGSNFLDQNAAGCPHYSGRGIPTTDPTCFNYVAGEWLTVQKHIQVGAFGSPNSVVELWLAHQGQPAELVVNASDAALVNDGSGGASGKYGKIVLLPYQTGLTGSLVDTAVWYDDLMVATRRIPDPDVATPNAPDSLSLTNATTQSVTVNWRVNSQNGTVQDDTGFLVERCTGNGESCFPNPQSGFTQIGTTAAGAGSYIDQTAVAGTTYTYRVRAKNAAGNSGYAVAQCFNASGTTCGSTISIP